MSLFEIILLAIVILVVVGIASGKLDAKKLKEEVRGMIDNRKPSMSAAAPVAVQPAPIQVDHQAIISAALQGAANVTQAAQPTGAMATATLAPIVPPAPVPAAPAAVSPAAVDPALAAYYAQIAANPGLAAYLPKPGSAIAGILEARATENTPGVEIPITEVPKELELKPGTVQERRRCVLEAGVKYTMRANGLALVISPTAGDPAGQNAMYEAVINQPDGTVEDLGRGSKVFPIQASYGSFTIGSDVKSEIWFEIRKPA